jgi:hypothetical protein
LGHDDRTRARAILRSDDPAGDASESLVGFEDLKIQNSFLALLVPTACHQVLVADEQVAQCFDQLER